MGVKQVEGCVVYSHLVDFYSMDSMLSEVMRSRKKRMEITFKEVTDSHSACTGV